MPDTQLAVIGAGPGGYAAAFLAADLGLHVTVIDPETNPGGVCLYRGCIPSKALLHVAKILADSRDAAKFGIHFGEPRVDLDRLRAWGDQVVGELTSGLGQLAKQRKVRHVRGRARFKDPRTLVVEAPKGGGESEMTFEHAIVATGSRPAGLPGLPEDPRVMNSTVALRVPDVPPRLLVIGGGYIGLELGTVYAALGSRVTVVEMMDGLLPGVDRDLVQVLERRIRKEFEAILLKTRCGSIETCADGIRVRFEGDGAPEEALQRFDRVLVSVGRKPNSTGLGLENTKVEVDDRGFIRVDAQMRTAEPSIFAIGDVVGNPMLAHKASHEGRVAAEVIVGRKAAFEPKAIPAVVFTEPEIAWAGLTEDEAAKAGRAVKVARFPWGASGRAKTLGESNGVTKLVVEPETERVLGVGIAGAGAGEMIAEGVLAIEMGAVVKDLALSIHPHPTLSETMMEAAEVFFGHATHIYRPKKA